MDKEHFEELCSAYVLGALEKDEAREFERALSERDPELINIYVEMQRVAYKLPLSVEMVEPPQSVKEQIMRTIRGSGSVPVEGFFAKLAVLIGFGKPQIAVGFSLALLVIVFGLSYYTFFLKETVRQRDNQLTQMTDEMKRQYQQFTAVRDELKKKEELLKVLQSPRIDVVIMNGLEVNPKGYGKIIWDPDKKSAILQISNLPAVPQGKDYQLWVIKDKKPISAGVFTVNDPAKENLFKIEELIEVNKKSINAFAITLEPKGGVPQPTGAMYLLGTPSL